MMPVQTTGYTSQSPLHYLLDAGAVYKNMTYDALTGEFTGELLGATSGGNEFALAQEIRVIEVDGLKGQGKGNVVVDAEVPSLTINLKELTAQNIALTIAGSDIDSSNEFYEIITSKGKIELTDYLDNISFVGRISGSERPIVIIIDNVLSLEGLTIGTADKAESVVPVVLTGHYAEDNVELGQAPYRIYYPKMDAVV